MRAAPRSPCSTIWASWRDATERLRPTVRSFVKRRRFGPIRHALKQILKRLVQGARPSLICAHCRQLLGELPAHRRLNVVTKQTVAATKSTQLDGSGTAVSL